MATWPNHRHMTISKRGITVRSSKSYRLLAALAAVLAIGVVAAIASAGASNGTAPPATSAAAKQTIVETAVAAGRFKPLASLLTKAGLADSLATGGTFTVLAPTDAAFKKVPKRALTALRGDPARLEGG